MTLRFLHFVEPVIVHSEFLGRLEQAEVSLRTAHRAAEGLGPVINIIKPAASVGRIVGRRRSAANLSVGLGERTKSEGAMWPRSNHVARLEPAGGQ
jgi:hypothetical protein